MPARSPSSLSRAAICALVCVGDNARTRSTTCGLVWRSSHDILYRGIARRVRASVCHRIATSMTLPRLESVTSLINQRSSCLRSTKVVVGACQMAGRLWASARICSRCEAVSNRAACLGNRLCSRSSFSTSVSFSFQSRSRLRATNRLSGSTAL